MRKHDEEACQIQLEVWISQIAENDQVSFRQLHDAIYFNMLAIVLNIIRRRELAEEVVQEGFIAIWVHASSYRCNMSTPMAWLSTIMRNKAYDLYRKQTRSILEINYDISDNTFAPTYADSTSLDSGLQALSDSRTLAQCLTLLDSLQRQTISLSYFADLTQYEVAARLDRPIGTVKTAIRRGLAKMRVLANGNVLAELSPRKDACEFVGGLRLVRQSVTASQRTDDFKD
ncbi:RNA polymerase sigma factor [Undibacterium sp. Ji42W]|uniref:RNA polymerase sigma factor n=1 Tax=Undibacterium sp. Ji42W TaxID=3413039 RepID=UPI003BF134D2